MYPHPYYFLFMQFFFHNHNFDPYSTYLNLQFFAPLVYTLGSNNCVYFELCKKNADILAYAGLRVKVIGCSIRISHHSIIYI